MNIKEHRLEMDRTIIVTIHIQLAVCANGCSRD